MTTKIPVELSSTPGIVDGSNATAITIDSSEDVTLAGHLVIADNKIVKFGAAPDLQIYHDASDSYIKDTGSGNLLIQGSDIYMGDTSNNHAFVIRATGNVGIGGGGTADTKLHLKDTGSIEVRLEADSNNSGQEDCFIRFYTDGKTQEGIVGMDNNNSSTLFNSNTENAMVFGCVSNLPVVFATNNTERMQISAAGDVGIGTTGPQAKFMVNQATVNEVGGFFYNNTSTNAACLRVLQDGAGSSGPALLVRQDGSGNAITVDDGSDGNTVFSVSQNGALSKASGSFKIDHPLPAKKDTHHLVHSFVEAPQADNIYRGTATLSGGTATINLDTVSGMTEGTYVLLNTNTSCFTSNETDWDAVKGSVSGNILTINCQNSSSTATVSWLVIGERHDQHMKDTDWTDDNGKVIVEPLKGE